MNLKRKAVFVEWEELQDGWRERIIFGTILGWERRITCQAPNVFQVCTEHYPFYSSRNPKWLGRYYSHFSHETESWSDSSIVTWLLQRQACIWSHIHLSGSYIQVFFIAPSSLLLLWLFLSCLLCLIFYFYTFNTKVT